MMPQIDLEPNKYRKQDRRTGKWHLPDDPKLCRNMFFVAAAVVGFIFWNRDGFEGHSATLVGVVAMFAFAGGILFSQWLKDVY